MSLFKDDFNKDQVLGVGNCGAVFWFSFIDNKGIVNVLPKRTETAQVEGFTEYTVEANSELRGILSKNQGLNEPKLFTNIGDQKESLLCYTDKLYNLCFHCLNRDKKVLTIKNKIHGGRGVSILNISQCKDIITDWDQGMINIDFSFWKEDKHHYWIRETVAISELLQKDGLTVWDYAKFKPEEIEESKILAKIKEEKKTAKFDF